MVYFSPSNCFQQNSDLEFFLVRFNSVLWAAGTLRTKSTCNCRSWNLLLCWSSFYAKLQKTISLNRISFYQNWRNSSTILTISRFRTWFMDNDGDGNDDDDDDGVTTMRTTTMAETTTMMKKPQRKRQTFMMTMSFSQSYCSFYLPTPCCFQYAKSSLTCERLSHLENRVVDSRMYFNIFQFHKFSLPNSSTAESSILFV